MQRTCASRRVETALIHPAHIQTALNSGTGTILNLSLGGAFVSTSISILPCAHAYIHLPIPEKRRFVRLEALAVWENRGRNRISTLPEGYGFKFIRISKEAAMGIRLLMDTQQPQDTASSSERIRDPRGKSHEALDALSEILLGFNGNPSETAGKPHRSGSEWVMLKTG